MAAKERLLRLLDRLTALVPGSPAEPTMYTTVPDPDERGISDETRQARLRLRRYRFEKRGKGGNG
ncbi:MAG: hypothetical protein H6Q36_489 [Chloroflexi bacterium]|jgi:hypothetical protein|nr:hypothetical protein [Chloroflexota bacterium]